MLPIERTCPFGHDCEKAGKNDAGKDVLLRCAAYVCLKGKDPQSENIHDEWGCVLQWMPILLVELSRVNVGQTAAIESARNEIVARQDILNNLAQPVESANINGGTLAPQEIERKEQE